MNKRFPRRTGRSTLIAFTIFSAAAGATPACAWGPNGHAIVADIAQAHLTLSTLAAAKTLLAAEGHDSLDQVASWPDTIGHIPKNKGGAPETLAWHYVDIDAADPAYDQSRDCPDTNCVTEKLPEQERILADRSAPVAQRLAALKWVVHLVGDVHQPLHAAERDHDKGGNTVKLTYFGNSLNGHMNLHSLWDEGIIDHATGLTVGPHYTIDFGAAQNEAKKLDKDITDDEIAYWTADLTTGDDRKAAIDWVDESHSLARTVAYGALPHLRGSELGDDYATLAWPVARLRLEQAGIRLAAVLNASLGDNK
ncbi:nuclease [Acetobacter musti]|uniref:Nuclease n=1 Tax=Acetobacter musti TaxID=864732 RepID=A0ABX0JVA2_9PROT|nr:S1/P1 nuclease [Acetobacter musti]NHN85923.1 nuclease [Acetobacter musti]